MGSPDSSEDGHQSPRAPARDRPGGGTALLIIDMINRFDFPDAGLLRTAAETIVEPVLRLRREVEAANCPVIYVNDNFGEWHSERSRLVDAALGNGAPALGRLAPDAQDYFIIKPQFSGFYATNLPVLLPKLGVNRLILTGISADICVLFTAADAHMRDYALWVPADCVAAQDEARKGWALSIMAQSMGACTRPTDNLDPRAWLAGEAVDD